MVSVKLMVEQVLEKEAPDELFLLAVYNESARSAKPTSGGPMGIGVEHVAVLLLPLIWEFFKNILSELSKESARETVKLLKKMLTRSQSAGVDMVPVAEGSEEAHRLRTLITEDLSRNGIDLEKYPNMPETVFQTLMTLVNNGAER